RVSACRQFLPARPATAAPAPPASARDRQALAGRAARGHDARAARDLLQCAWAREAQARTRQGQEDARQARDRGQARLAAPEGAAHAGERLMRAADERGAEPSAVLPERERLLAIEHAA